MQAVIAQHHSRSAPLQPNNTWVSDPHHQSRPSKSRRNPYPSTSPRKASNLKQEEDYTPDFPRSFREANQPKLSRCHRCLGRDKHDIRWCSRTTLWNGKQAVLCNWNRNGYLEISRGNYVGLELCADWQRPNGCTGKTHPEKHCCSGCAQSSHGAENCPEGQ
ncbi:hypothetical protein GG344DRAFT_53227 [Lentinula edodes]|nr:hypothetical protein GG344DRAFT_53227 [Lentinula edodes]